MKKLLSTVSIYHPLHFSDLLLLFYVITNKDFMYDPLLLTLLYEVYNLLTEHFQN